MSSIVTFFTVVFFNPVVNLLAILLHLLTLAHIPGAMGFSIILLTVLIRLITWPLMSTQLKSSKKMAQLKPHLDILKAKHGKDKQALAQAQSALYKEHGVNPAAGCLPVIVQIIVLGALYRVIFAFLAPNGLQQINSTLYSSVWHLNVAPDPNFLWFNLAKAPSDFAHLGLYVLAIPVFTAILQYVQSSMMTSMMVVKSYPSDSPKEKKEKETAEDMQSAMQTQMKYMMPIMLGFFAFQFPIGLALYYNTTTIIGIIQQYFINGTDGIPTPSNMFGTKQSTAVKTPEVIPATKKQLASAKQKTYVANKGKTKVKIERT